MQRNDTPPPSAEAAPAPAPIQQPQARMVQLPTLRQVVIGFVVVMGVITVFTLVTMLVSVLLIGLMPLDPMSGIPLDALSAAGAFGKGGNQQMVHAVTAVVDAAKNNLLGFVGATFILVILGCAAGLIFGSQHVHERLQRVAVGVFALVAASGFVA